MADARPMAGADREPLLDALRGFALLGILLVNVPTYDGRLFRPTPLAGAELWSHTALQLLCDDRFWTLFYFLFGVGAARQLERMAASRYLRRMAVLFGLGLVHLAFVYFADILTRYAVVGALLLLFRRRSDRALLAISAFCIVAGAVGAGLVSRNLRLAGPLIQQWLQVIDYGRYADLVAINLRFKWFELTSLYEAPMAIATLGRLLLGYLLGRRQLLTDAAQHRRFFGRLLLGGLVGAILADLVLAMRPGLGEAPVAHALVSELATLSTSTIYFAGFVLLWQRPGARRSLALLAPAGRMSLTNYLSQNLIGLLVFYHLGLGLAPFVSLQAGMGFAVALWLVQVAWSRAWLRAYAFGPFEWLWRAATYGHLPALRRAPTLR